MTAFALLLALAAPQEPAPPKPAALLGAMLGRYANARTLAAKVEFRQTANAAGQTATLGVTTDLALERPARLRIAQKSTKRADKVFLVTSDGTEFSTDVPDLTAPPGLRLTQTVADPNGEPNAGRVLAFSRDSLPDRYNPFLAVAVSAPWDLQNLRGEWASLQDGGAGEVGGVACRIVKGKWRPGKDQPVTGTFGIWITPAGDLLKYSTETSFDAVDIDDKDEQRKPLGKVTILSEWTGTITLNPSIPDGTFRVIR